MVKSKYSIVVLFSSLALLTSLIGIPDSINLKFKVNPNGKAEISLDLKSLADPFCTVSLQFSKDKIFQENYSNFTIGPANFRKGSIDFKLPGTPVDVDGNLVATLHARSAIDCSNSEINQSSQVFYSSIQSVSLSKLSERHKIKEDKFFSSLTGRSLTSALRKSRYKFSLSLKAFSAANKAPEITSDLSDIYQPEDKDIVLRIGAEGSKPVRFNWLFSASADGKFEKLTQKQLGLEILSDSEGSSLIIRSSLIDLSSYLNGYVQVEAYNRYGTVRSAIAQIISTDRPVPTSVPTVIVPTAIATKTPTLLPSSTPVRTATSTPTKTSTSIPKLTNTPSKTATHTPTKTSTSIPLATNTPTRTATRTPTRTATNTPTKTFTATSTPASGTPTHAPGKREPNPKCKTRPILEDGRPWCDNTGPSHRSKIVHTFNNPVLVEVTVGSAKELRIKEGSTGTPRTSAAISYDSARGLRVLENFHAKGSLSIEARNVLVRNFIVEDGSVGGADISPSDTEKNIYIEDGEIMGSPKAQLGGSNYIAKRLHIHHGAQDFSNANSNISVEDSYFHSGGYSPGAHTDAIQYGSKRIGENVTYKGNYFYMPFRSTSDNNPNPPGTNWPSRAELENPSSRWYAPHLVQKVGAGDFSLSDTKAQCFLFLENPSNIKNLTMENNWFHGTAKGLNLSSPFASTVTLIDNKFECIEDWENQSGLGMIEFSANSRSGGNRHLNPYTGQTKAISASSGQSNIYCSKW